MTNEFLIIQAKAELELRRRREIKAEQFIDPDPVRWITKNFWVPEIKDKPMPLYPFHAAGLREALAIEPDGKFRYSTVVWSAIKKSIKSTIAAAVALWMAYQKPWSTIKVVANDLKQADSRVFYYIVRCLLINKELGEQVRIKNHQIILPNHSIIEAIPIDPSGEAGANDDLVIYSELWGWRHDSAKKMWTETTLSPLKFGHSIRWCETYAGFNGESPILEELYDRGVLNGQCFDQENEFYRNDRLLVIWNTHPTCPWQTPEYYCLPIPQNGNDLMALTKNGWKSSIDITTTDELATRNLEGKIEYQHPTSIFRNIYSGELLRLKNSKTNLVMTPNHRIFGAFSGHTRKVKHMLEEGLQFNYKTADEASKCQIGWIPGVGQWEHEELESFQIENETYNGNDIVEFMGWYLSEGNLNIDNRNKKPYYSMISISQDRYKNPQKCDQIRKLLDRMKLNYSQNKNQFRIFNSRISRFCIQFGKSHEKFIPRFILDNCSSDQIKLFLETYKLGDGTDRSFGGSWVIYTNSDQMALDLLECGFKAGWRPKRGKSYSSSPETGRRPIHHLYFLKSHIGWSTGNRRKHWTTESAPENCEVWCPSIPNGNFYVMQNGSCFWTGNSQESANLLDVEFQRIHRNQWGSSTSSFVPGEWWDACGVPQLPAYEELEPWVIALDAAIDGDCFGLVATTRKNGITIVRHVRKWVPPEGGKIMYFAPAGTPPELDESPAGELRRICDRHSVVKVVFDPYQLHSFCSQMKEELIVYFDEFQQMGKRLIADKLLRDTIRERHIIHDGDIDLREHVLNANAKADGESDKLRIVKRRESRKIDLAVCLSMSNYEAIKLNLG